MTDPRIEILEKKLSELQAREKVRRPPLRTPDSSLSQGLRMGTEFVAAIIVPAAAGYGLDRYFETKPLFMLALLLLGIGAGFLNLYRASLTTSGLPKSDQAATRSQPENQPDSQAGNDND